MALVLVVWDSLTMVVVGLELERMTERRRRFNDEWLHGSYDSESDYEFGVTPKRDKTAKKRSEQWL